MGAVVAAARCLGGVHRSFIAVRRTVAVLLLGSGQRHHRHQRIRGQQDPVLQRRHSCRREAADPYRCRWQRGACDGRHLGRPRRPHESHLAVVGIRAQRWLRRSRPRLRTVRVRRWALKLEQHAPAMGRVHHRAFGGIALAWQDTRSQRAAHLRRRHLGHQRLLGIRLRDARADGRSHQGDDLFVQHQFGWSDGAVSVGEQQH